MKDTKSTMQKTVSYVYLAILGFLAGFPLYWIIVSSFKSPSDITNNPISLLPKEFTLENFRNVLYELDFITNITNSIIISFTTTVIAITVSALAAYGIVRFFDKFGKAMTKVLITTYMFPPILLAIPYASIMGALGLFDNRFGLVIVYLSFSIPYAIWLLVGFFQTVPIGIEEAARIDGANKLHTFVRIVLPLVSPGLVATAIYTFINVWNEFLYSLILMNSTNKMTVSVALKSLEGAEIFSYGNMMAASVLVVLPSVIFFMIIQRKITGGLAEGSVK